MNEQLWNQMTDEQQEQFCLARLAGKLQRAAQEMTSMQPGNAETFVLPGLTTIVGRKETA